MDLSPIHAISAEPMLPAWLAVPVCGLALLAVAGHASLMRRTPMPESRRRIRQANAWLMALTIPVVAYAFSWVSRADARAFVLAWLLVVGLIGLITLVAILDILNSLRLRRAELRTLRREFDEVRRALADRALAARAHRAPAHEDQRPNP